MTPNVPSSHPASKRARATSSSVRSPSITTVNSYSGIATLLLLAPVDRPPDLFCMVGRNLRRRPDPHQTVVSDSTAGRPTPGLPGAWRLHRPTVTLGELERLLDLLLGMPKSTWAC